MRIGPLLSGAENKEAATAFLQSFLGGDRFEPPFRLSANNTATNTTDPGSIVLAFQPVWPQDSFGIRYAVWTNAKSEVGATQQSAKADSNRTSIAFRPIRSGSAACCGWPGGCFRLYGMAGKVAVEHLCPDAKKNVLTLNLTHGGGPFYLEPT